MFNKLLDKSEKIAVVGLGYVGLPLANLFSKKNMTSLALTSIIKR